MIDAVHATPRHEMQSEESGWAAAVADRGERAKMTGVHSLAFMVSQHAFSKG